MHVQRHRITLTTDASGDATGYTPVVNGRVVNVIYTADGSSPFAATADFTATLEATGQPVWSASDVSASTTVAPRQPTHDTDGNPSLYAAAGEPVEDHIFAAEDRVKIVVAQGGDSKVGVFDVVIA